MTTPLLETPLAAWHTAHGGRMVAFAGWTMPGQFASIVEEHLATRRAAGLVAHRRLRMDVIFQFTHVMGSLWSVTAALDYTGFSNCSIGEP